MSAMRRVLFKNIGRRTCGILRLNKTRHYSQNVQENCIKSKHSDVIIPEVTFAEFIVSSFSNYPDKIAVQCGVTKRKYTYDEVLVKATNLNKSLRKNLKLGKGDVIAFLLPNIPEYVICALGVQLAGLRLTTINPVYTSGEIKRQLLDADAKVLITLPELWKNAKEAVDETKKNLNIITVKNATTDTTPDGAIDLQELMNTKLDMADAQLISPHETIFMPYSSGTTGLPKGVELSNYNIVANICQMQHPNVSLLQPTTDAHQDVTVAVLPLFHIYGFTSTFYAMTSGMKVVTLPKFTPDTYLDSLRDFRPHVLMLVPPIVIYLYSNPNVRSEYLSSLRTINSGAAPLGALDEHKFREKVGKPLNVIQGYGLSETSPAVTLVPISVQGKYPGSMGMALPNTLLKVIAIDDREGKHLNVNETGELLVKGPQVMKGYFNKPEETRNAFLDGWFRTGDLVRYDEHGMFYIADRIKELIKVKGFQVPPAELEELLRDFPGVAEAAVIGVPHEFNGEVPRAYVVPKKDSAIDVDKLKVHVESKVAKFKRLQGGIAVVDDIPKNASGKILRRQLKLKFQDTGV